MNEIPISIYFTHFMGLILLISIIISFVLQTRKCKDINERLLCVYALLGCIHFLLSACAWAPWVFDTIKDSGLKHLGFILPFFACIIMVLGFLSVMFLVARHTKLSIKLLIMLYVTSAVWFVFDAKQHKYLIQAMTDHGCEHYYATWWWYNDRWDPNR